MAQLSNAFETEIINVFLRNQARTFFGGGAAVGGTVYLALSTAAASETATGASMSEVTGTGYARQSVTMGAPTDGVSTNSGLVEFTATAGDWTGPILSVYLVDSASGAGNVLLHDDITSVSLGNGDKLQFASGTGITVTLA